MIKIKIIKNKELNFESKSYFFYSSERTIEWNDLSSADLSSADLSYANLRSADLSSADLSYANLRSADLSSADLSSADLSYAYLSSADLSYANLRSADLRGAYLRNADLRNANLHYVHLEGAELRGANLDDTELDEEEKCRKGVILKRKIIGYKKCKNDIIVKLEIPKGAIVFSINNEKCRTNVAKVVDIDNNLSEATSKFDKNFIYKKGEKIEIEDFNLMYNVECGSGIHFFRTKKEAEEYEL